MKNNPVSWLRKFLFVNFIVLLFSHTCMYGQSLRNTPYYASKDEAVRQKLAETTAASIRDRFQEPAQFNKEAKKAYLTQRERIAENVSQEISENALQDDILWPFLKSTFDAIIAANPRCAGAKVILAKDPTPNAYSVGDGTIIVYTGLLAGLENEDQLAFVLCHEMAHFLLEHPTKGLERQITTYYSKEFKDKLESTKALEYNQYEQFQNIFKNALFNSRYHHRDLERQADSLAYQLYVKTTYNPAQAQRLMQLFEYIDEPLRDSVLHIEQNYGCGQYPFQKTWLQQERSSVWAAATAAQAAAEKSMQDSLRTHPDWQNRMRWIAEISGPLPEKTATARDYSPIRFLSALENTEAWFKMERYDRTLYYAALYRTVYPDCQYFQEIQSLSLYGLYTHSKDHTMARVLSQSAQDYPDKYNLFLDFLNSLRLKDLLGLQACNLDGFARKDTEYGLMAAYCLALLQDERGKMNSIKREYRSGYRNGRFIEFFKEDKK